LRGRRPSDRRTRPSRAPPKDGHASLSGRFAGTMEKARHPNAEHPSAFRRRRSSSNPPTLDDRRRIPTSRPCAESLSTKHTTSRRGEGGRAHLSQPRGDKDDLDEYSWGTTRQISAT